MESKPDSEAQQYYVHFFAHVLETSEAQNLVSLLELQPNQNYYRLAYPFVQKEKAPVQDTIHLRPRSLLGIMSFLSQGVEVPKQHDQESIGITSRLYEFLHLPDEKKLRGFSLKVKSQSTRPQRAAVAVHYRDYWFFIDDADLVSKATFALLNQIFALQASAISVTPPVLTLPVGQ